MYSSSKMECTLSLYVNIVIKVNCDGHRRRRCFRLHPPPPILHLVTNGLGRLPPRSPLACFFVKGGSKGRLSRVNVLCILLSLLGEHAACWAAQAKKLIKDEEFWGLVFVSVKDDEGSDVSARTPVHTKVKKNESSRREVFYAHPATITARQPAKKKKKEIKCPRRELNPREPTFTVLSTPPLREGSIA